MTTTAAVQFVDQAFVVFASELTAPAVSPKIQN